MVVITQHYVLTGGGTHMGDNLRERSATGTGVGPRGPGSSQPSAPHNWLLFPSRYFIIIGGIQPTVES